MLTYKQVLDRKEIIGEYKKIDKENNTPFNHGLNHVKNVCEIMDKLCKTLNIDGEQRECLLLSAALHDIGQTMGRENHGIKACDYIINNLENDLKEYKYYKDMLDAIRDHSEKVDLLKLPVFTNLLCFADKMDFTFKRLESNSNEKFGYTVYEDVVNVDFMCEDNVFTLKIDTTDKIDKEDLLNEGKFFYKVISATITLTKKLNFVCNIKVNDTNLDLYEVIKKDYPKVEKYACLLKSEE